MTQVRNIIKRLAKEEIVFNNTFYIQNMMLDCFKYFGIEPTYDVKSYNLTPVNAKLLFSYYLFHEHSLELKKIKKIIRLNNLKIFKVVPVDIINKGLTKKELSKIFN